MKTHIAILLIFLIGSLTASIFSVSAQSEPEIIYFHSDVYLIELDAVTDSLIPVSWAVVNRPESSNLIFEQVLDNGTVRNAELPRDVEIVPSVGEGVVTAILDDDAPEQLTFRLQLVDLDDSTVYDTMFTFFTVYDPDEYTEDVILVEGDACFSPPFPSDQGIHVGGEGRVQHYFSGTSLPLYVDGEIVASLQAGDTFTIESESSCTYYADGDSFRQWQINFNGQQGWVHEYRELSGDVFVFTFVDAERDDYPIVTIDQFSVSPESVAFEDLASTTFTITWETSHADDIHISQTGGDIQDFEADGSLTVLGSDLQYDGNVIEFGMYAGGVLGNAVWEDVSVPIITDTSINDFSVSPDTARGNEQVTFSWDIEGDFETASIYFNDRNRPSSSHTIHLINSNVGSFSYTLPDSIVGNYAVDLILNDVSGITITESLNLEVNCAYEWDMPVSELSCPSTALISQTGVYQQFQRGFMVWLPNETNSIWVFYNDGTFAQHQDAWDGSDYSIEGTAPDGNFAPERGFGYLWQSDPIVRSGLGWAAAPEQSYTVNFQRNLITHPSYSLGFAFVQLPEGQVVRAYEYGVSFSNTWEIAE